MKMLTLLLLVPSLAAAQGLTSSPPGVSSARTNWLKQSNSISNGTAPTSPWAFSSATTTTVAGAPAAAGGGTWAQLTSTGLTGNIQQNFTVPSSTRLYGSVWMAKASGTGYAAMAVYCGAANVPTTCSCTRSDGGSCTASTATPFNDRCTAVVADLGTTEIRLMVNAVCATAVTTAPYVMLYPGQATVAVGTSRFTGAMLETNVSKASKICVTTTAAKTCK